MTKKFVDMIAPGTKLADLVSTVERCALCTLCDCPRSDPSATQMGASAVHSFDLAFI